MTKHNGAEPIATGTVIADYEEFLRENRARVNARMNRILWICILGGPAIALGIAAGVFHGVAYWTCLNVSLLEAGLSLLHLLLVKRRPDSIVTSLYAMLAIDCLLVYMAYAGVGIYLTWFLVPVMSLLFCERRIFRAAVGINYLFMLTAMWLSAPEFAALRNDYASAAQYFVSMSAGYTIETFVMFVAGDHLCKTASGYYRDLLDNYKTLLGHERRMEQQMDLLDSMAEIYDNVNLLDLERMTEMSLRNDQFEACAVKRGGQTHTHMSEQIMTTIAEEYREAFRTFTDINTLPERLKDKKIVSGEFVSRETGWLRAQYIVVETGDDGAVTRVVFTTQNIDVEKTREERLRRISLTDELTGLYNRRSYEEDMAAYGGDLPEDFTVFSVDVNGLKPTNDVLGHAAGDELLRGTAECLSAVFEKEGRAYRTGGDEFIAVLRTREYEAVCTQLRDMAAAWRGGYIDAISLSIGYASRAEHPDAGVRKLEKMADAMMYVDKDRYYRSSGLDRRSRSSAYAALCGVCVKILKIDLGTDSCAVLNIDDAEKVMQTEYAGSFSRWMSSFAASGGVAVEDRDEFLRRTDLEYLRTYFASGEHCLTVCYARRAQNGYRRAAMDLVRDADFNEENRVVYLSVRYLDG